MGAPDLLEFDVLDHEYSMNGASMPGVTRIMASQFPLNVPKERLEFARQMGVAIHTATELYDRGTLDWDSVDPKVVPYLDAWRKFRADTSCEVIEIELRVHHPVLRYAGTLDRIVGMMGCACVLDLKRPALGPRVGVQLAGYQRAYNEWVKVYSPQDQQALRRFGIQLKSDGNYRLREYKEDSDWTIFMACYSLYNWKARHDEH